MFSLKKQYDAGYLPEGRHRFTAVLEFEPVNSSEPLLVVGSLYLDIRPTGILHSNVSFDQIDREVLYRELQEQVLAGMEYADSMLLSKQAADLESIDSEIIDRKIKELIASDPDIARRVQELNTAREDSVPSTERMRSYQC